MTEATYLAKITPFGGLSLRDARPFQAEEDSTARAPELVPPAPTPFYYALRDALHPVDVATRRAVHNVPKAFDLRLRGLWLSDGERDYYPVPADLFLDRVDEEVKEGALRSPRLQSPGAGSNVDGLRRLWHSGPTRASEATGAFLDENQLGMYLQGLASDITSTMPGWKLRLTSGRIGLELESGDRVSRDGRLYSRQVTFLPEEGCYKVQVQLRSVVDAARNGKAMAVRLGGESRMALVELCAGTGAEPMARVREKVKEQVLQEARKSGVLRVKLCLLTPTVFSANVDVLKEYSARGTPVWRHCLRPGEWRLPFDEGTASAELVAAAVPRAVPLGAWDQSRNAERDAGPGATKPLYRCVPAGAVYFLEVKPAPGKELAAVLEGLFNLYWFNTILLRKGGKPTHFGEMGFGIAAIGAWSPADRKQ